MGAWGTRVYEDDTALDVRDQFLDAHKAGVPIDEIEAEIYCDYNIGEAENDDVVTLGLCCVELETGTLTDKTKQAALAIIDSGRQYDFWMKEAGKEDAALRKREMTLIRKYIEKYEGKPVRRKSWVALQREQEEDRESNGNYESTLGAKMDDVDWHAQGVDNKLDEETYFAYAGAHIACFVYWLISRGYLAMPDATTEKQMQQVKDGTLLATSFLLHHMDLKLFSGEIDPAVRNFAVAYYLGGTAVYMLDYAEAVVGWRKMYSFAPDKQDYEKMAQIIDKRLTEYQQHPYSAAPMNERQRNLAARYWRYIAQAVILGFIAVLCGVASYIIRIYLVTHHS